MNNPTQEPITNPGLTWALGKIMGQFEKAAQSTRKEVLENPEPPKADHGRDTEHPLEHSTL